MKSSHLSTSAQELPPLPPIAAWSLTLQQVHARVAPHVARPEVRRHARLYLEAVLSDIPRKNGWQIAEQARQARPDGIQRLLSHAVWDQDAVRDELRALVWQTLHPPPTMGPAEACQSPLLPVLVLDESAFPKRGHHSAGVAPQYCGRTGRVENCQVGVFLSYVTQRGHALIDRELYLPQDWCDDAPRRQAAHIPATVGFATKPELGKRMIQRAHAAGLPFDWVVADTVYGHSPDLRLFLEKQAHPYAMAVPASEVVCVQTLTGPLLSEVADIAQRALRPKDWCRLSQSLGTKGERLFDWARLPVLDGGSVDGRHWLVVRRCLDDPHEMAYYLVWAPLHTPLPQMVQAIGGRWHIEEDLHTCKALGLDHYEVRSFVGWARHITLVLLAAAFLLSITVPSNAATTPPDTPIPPQAPCGPVAPVIAWTPAEVQHLLAHLFFPPPSSVSFILAWSQFRRTHQYWARWYHRRRRLKAQLA